MSDTPESAHTIREASDPGGLEPPCGSRSVDAGGNDSAIESKLVRIIDLPDEERNSAIRAFLRDHPDRETELVRLLAHAKEIDEAEARGIQTPPLVRLEKIRKRSGSIHRYELSCEVTHGGMGVIHRVWDDDLGRSVAMKVIRQTSATDSHRDALKLERFIGEAQITSQLDHPGVIPVYDFGVDPEGGIYYTMPFVKGRTAHEVILLAHEGKEGWDVSRVLEVLLKVCDTLAFAHARHVVHRDVKPSNVMVGRFGEVYLVDWGLAKVRGQAERTASRPKIGEELGPTLIRTDRDKKYEGTSSTTQQGTILGTPCYMSPEQAFGRLEEVGPASDIYSVGAMLYFLLTKEEPYCGTGPRPSANQVLDSLLEGPPRTISSLAPKAPVELVAICEKAMARKIAHRYMTIEGLANDLRAFLAGRVVAALPAGPLVELRKWVGRNRALAAACAALLLALITGFVVSLTFFFQASHAERDAQETAEFAQTIIRDGVAISRGGELRALRKEAESYWPLGVHLTQPIEAWLERAEGLARLLPVYRERLQALGQGENVRNPQERVVRLPRLSEEDLSWYRKAYADAVGALESFVHGAASDGLQSQNVADMRRRLEEIARVREQTEAGRVLWETVRSELAQDERFAQFTLHPQEGLVPLGRDEVGGLQEFWVVGSGTRPEPNPDYPDRGPNRWRMTPEAGIVLVLVPGGPTVLGTDPTEEQSASQPEGPTYEVDLEPYFLSKYELTQSQWVRLSGSNPSFCYSGQQRGTITISPSHPVESMTRDEALGELRKLGLTLPTEAQWEHACRATTRTPWSFGDADPMRFANVCDQATRKLGADGDEEDFEFWDDDYGVHAPVGSFAPNGWSFFDMHGNVREWCLDGFALYDEVEPRAGDGYREGNQGQPIHRGGSWQLTLAFARSSYRETRQGGAADYDIGIRPARRVNP